MNKMLLLIMTSMLACSLLIAGCGGGTSGNGTSGTGSNVGVAEGQTAPDFQLQSLDGRTVSLSGLRGKPVLMNFWATWCGPCLEEMPMLQEVASEWAAKGLQFLSIDCGESTSMVQGFMQRYSFSFPTVLADSKNEVAGTFNIMYLPTTFLIDKDGVIQSVTVGAFASKDELEQKVLSKVFP